MPSTSPEPVAAPLRQRAQPPRAVRRPEAGLRWAELRPADAPELARLVTRMELVDQPPYRTTEAEMAEYFEDSHVVSALGGRDEVGTLRAFGFVRLRRGEVSLLRAVCSGGVDPVWRRRGVGSALLDWQVDRARQLLVETGLDVPARIVVHVDENMPDLAGLLERAGFTPRRWYTQMRRDLSLAIPEVVLGPALRLEPWSPALDDAARRAHNTAFSDHWGSQPQTAEAWTQGRTYFAPEWSFVVLDRTTDRSPVAGYLISARYEQDWPALGWTEGYTEVMGVLREWRGRHVGSALLAAAMRAYAADGMQYAGLDVDADNPTGARTLYERLGYEPTHGSTMYSIEI
ncbi:GNAT family N-acetyltransferase [Georgenia sp. 10Sc9-8]|uniref:GNAT family N-acetyltransferase n=1 Tax=Georgenia halotolerans TaxID=3028317 RepID=A0ABT5U1P6_9MICO|nr:GNAT family N-acetyltransferase [Georgenia halotolerans]